MIKSNFKMAIMIVLLTLTVTALVYSVFVGDLRELFSKSEYTQVEESLGTAGTQEERTQQGSGTAGTQEERTQQGSGMQYLEGDLIRDFQLALKGTPCEVKADGFYGPKTREAFACLMRGLENNQVSLGGGVGTSSENTLILDSLRVKNCQDYEGDDKIFCLITSEIIGNNDDTPGSASTLNYGFNSNPNGWSFVRNNAYKSSHKFSLDGYNSEKYPDCVIIQKHINQVKDLLRMRGALSLSYSGKVTTDDVNPKDERVTPKWSFSLGEKGLADEFFDLNSIGLARGMHILTGGKFRSSFKRPGEKISPIISCNLDLELKVEGLKYADIIRISSLKVSARTQQDITEALKVLSGENPLRDLRRGQKDERWAKSIEDVSVPFGDAYLGSSFGFKDTDLLYGEGTIFEYNFHRLGLVAKAPTILATLTGGRPNEEIIKMTQCTLSEKATSSVSRTFPEPPPGCPRTGATNLAVVNDLLRAEVIEGAARVIKQARSIGQTKREKTRRYRDFLRRLPDGAEEACERMERYQFLVTTGDPGASIDEYHFSPLDMKRGVYCIFAGMSFLQSISTEGYDSYTLFVTPHTINNGLAFTDLLFSGF